MGQNNIILLLTLTTCIGYVDSDSGSDDAYVTLLYGDEFLLGVRVLGMSIKHTGSTKHMLVLVSDDEFLLGVRDLGKSIKDTGSTKDMVALVSGSVSQFAKDLLKADGWIVEMISLLANPNQVRPKRFWGVYTKLKIFNMTKYKKVVYLDADTIVVKSIEKLFECGKFCANLKHSERLNSGVMVVEPSQSVFNDMMSKVTTLHSYTGGDQGFLNSYFEGFANAHIFEPELQSRKVSEMERLPTIYNADVGLYMLANKWMVDEKELHVIHYTLGPLKPWDWWTSWLLKPVDVWQNVRIQLEESLPGTGGGTNSNDELIVKLLFWLPALAFVFFYYRSYLQTHSLYEHMRHLYYKIRCMGGLPTITTATVTSNQQFPHGLLSKVPSFIGGLSIIVCFMAAVVSLALSLMIIPRQVMPWTGLLLMYEWTFTLFFILFGSYLHVIYIWAKMKANQVGPSSSHSESFDSEDKKGHQRHASGCDNATCYHGLGMAFLAVAAPSLPFLFGITALFLRLGLMFVGGLILASYMTYAAEHLGIRSFLKGLEEKDMSRTRSLCFFC